MRATARQRVLAFLQREPGASADQIGRGLEMSSATVRHHLGILRSDGRIVPMGERHDGARGRPATCYRPSERLLGDNLAMISDSLLRASAARTHTPPPDWAMGAMVDGLLQQLGPAADAAPIATRLGQLVDALDAAHYDARWEAGAEGPRLIYGHCPYSAIIDRHPELCEMDRLALAKYMGATAAQLAKIDMRSHDTSHCVFVLKAHASGRAGAGREGGE